ncbi:MAG TPA: LemA family protein [Bryobacteraceae bacterium]|nr:LemA family protein [Bryobacteraceae bacterium]
MRNVLLVNLLLLAVALAAWGEYTAVRTRLTAQQEAIGTEWAQVDLAMQARADLVSKLILPPGPKDESMPAREEARGAVAELERALAPADKIRANSELSAALAKLPRPKSEEALDRLSDAENRIAVERRRYNEMLEHYNALIQRFPDNIVARLAGFQRDPNYLPTEEQEPVQK